MQSEFSNDLFASLRSVVGERNVITDASELAVLGNDWSKASVPRPLAAVLPASTAEVSAVVRICRERGISMVPSGGRTGLAGGAVVCNGEVVVGLARMRRIERVDVVGMAIVCEAGVTTQEIQQAAADAGLFFALDLAAKGSSQIGGNLATNAGGLKVIRYGMSRDLVLGLEVVLPSGEVLDLNRDLRKDNTGYDLKQLFIGAEGTLGIITRVTLKLHGKPKGLQLACLGVHKFEAIPKILRECNLSGAPLAAFEFFTSKALDLVLRFHPSLRAPFGERTDYYVLIETDEPGGDESSLARLVESLFEDELVVDGVIATTSREFQDLWSLRENISESISQHGRVRKNDISLPIARLDGFLAGLQAELVKAPQGIDVIVFGHIGDGNLHINYISDRAFPEVDFKRETRAIEERVFALVAHFRGSVSAEHGVGLLKKADLKYSRSEAEIEIMRQIKRLFDPANLMNPGKIFDL